MGSIEKKPNHNRVRSFIQYLCLRSGGGARGLGFIYVFSVSCRLEEMVGKTCISITNLPPRLMMGIDSCGMLISAVHHEEGEEKLHLLMVDDHIPAGAKMY